MAADAIIYCLEQLTDYDQFERLCHDLMALEGYANIEPIGGKADKGRDAIHVNRADTADVTVFAYSVREDWRKKLEEDSRKIQGHHHACRRLVFLCTATFTPAQRDEAVSSILETFGWTLELYGLERLRVLLSASHPQVIASHPQIFSPPFFPTAGGVPMTLSRDLILVDYAESDEALGTWLARRLGLEGLRVWSRSTAPIGGASLHDTVTALINQRAFRYLAIISRAALADPDMAARRALAAVTAAQRGSPILIPIAAAQYDSDRLDAGTKQLSPVQFAAGWAAGLAGLLRLLEAAGCPREKKEAPGIAARSFIPLNVTRPVPERVLSNQFRVLTVPPVIYRYISTSPLQGDARPSASLQWAFRTVQPTCFLSFHEPPASLQEELGLRSSGGASWSDLREMDGIAVEHLVRELIWKSMAVRGIAKGLRFCRERNLLYFPNGLFKADRLYFAKPDGSRSFVAVAGQRTYWRPRGSSEYRYSLAPKLSVEALPDGGHAILLRVHIRLTDVQGNMLPRRTSFSRRKHLCKGWWNDDWLHRTLAVMQYLASDTTPNGGKLAPNDLAVSAVPDEWTVPLSIDEDAVADAAAAREELLDHSRDPDDQDDDD